MPKTQQLGLIKPGRYKLAEDWERVETYPQYTKWSDYRDMGLKVDEQAGTVTFPKGLILSVVRYRRNQIVAAFFATHNKGTGVSTSQFYIDYDSVGPILEIP